MEDKKIKILNKTTTGEDERGKSLMIVEDESMGNNPRRFYTAIAPKNFPVQIGRYISKIKEVSYVKPRAENIDEAKEMYEKLRKESK